MGCPLDPQDIKICSQKLHHRPNATLAHTPPTHPPQINPKQHVAEPYWVLILGLGGVWVAAVLGCSHRSLDSCMSARLSARIPDLPGLTEGAMLMPRC